MRITPIGTTFHLDTQTREHRNASPFQQLLEAHLKRA
jgi:hypothetical protein